MIAAAELETHRSALTGHCYRMLGSAVDADDAVQETMVRAWKSLGGFDGRSSLRTWLHRVATNVCLDALADRKARMRPVDEGPVGTPDDVLETRERTHWIEPVPDAHAIPADAQPEERLVLRQSIRLAFIAALQHLPPKQRAALILTEVLGWSIAECASCLEISEAAVNSALQRARATLAAKNLSELPRPLTDSQRELVDRYVSAFERYDVSALTSLLHEDATLSMPPFTLWLTGHAHIARWLSGPGAPCRGSKLVMVEASGMPAIAQYRPTQGGGYHAWAIIALEIEGDRIASMTSYLDVETSFPRFGLPLTTS
jgi:RNA polymerase sigma-70 factor (ECF subfamily)